MADCNKHGCELQGTLTSYPINVSIVSFKAKVDFPAVTICNLNRINCHNAFQVFQQQKANISLCDHQFCTSNGQATYKLIDKLADNEGSLSSDQYNELNSTLGIMLE